MFVVGGRIYEPKSGEKYWAVEIPSLCLFTQGKSLEDAYEMAKDAVESAVDKKGFKVEIVPHDGSHGHFFKIKANKPMDLFAFMLKQKRTSKGKSIRDISHKLGSKYPNTYAPYEQGKNITLETLFEVLHAIDPGAELRIPWSDDKVEMEIENAPVVPRQAGKRR